ncbi:APC family permease [Microbacterium resistens]
MTELQPETARPGVQRLPGGRLGVFAVVCLVVSAAAPLTVAASAGATSYRLGGLGGPLAMLVCAVVLICFSFGFTAMSGHVTNSAAFYAYVGKGFGRPAGLGVAAVTTFAYVVLTCSFYGFIGFFTAIGMRTIFGIEVHWFVGSALAWGVVTFLGHRSAEAGARVLAVILTGEVGILVILSVAALVNGGPEPMSLGSYQPGLLFVPGAAALFVLGFGAFVGFEGTAIYAEEAKRPKRTVPLATYIAVGFLGVFYSFVFWIYTVAFGVDGVLLAAQEDDFQDMIFIASTTYLGDWAAKVIAVLVVTSFLACVLAFHNSSARYIFSLGRDRVLPAYLGEVHPRHGSPSKASLTVSCIAAVPLIVVAVTGADVFLVFGLIAYAIGVAAIIFAQAVAALAVVAYFAKDRRGHSPWRVLIAPSIGALGLTVAWIAIVANFSIISGLEGAWQNIALILPTPILFVAGILLANRWRRTDPARFDGLAQDIGTTTIVVDRVE